MRWQIFAFPLPLLFFIVGVGGGEGTALGLTCRALDLGSSLQLVGSLPVTCET